MKINVEVDCTPEEARRAVGLPDLTPIHEAYVQAMMNAMKNTTLSPETIETLTRGWMPMGDAGMTFWRRMFDNTGKTD